MAGTERKWEHIPPRAFALNGEANGSVYLATTKNFKVKQKVAISATGMPTLPLEVKRVISPTQLIVGPVSSKMTDKQDLSGYTLATNPTIRAEEQDRSGIPTEQHERAVYAEEPVMAKRSILVDEFGEYYSKENPLPIDIEMAVENLNVDVKLDAFSANPDSSLSVGTEDGTASGIKHVIKIGSDLNLRVKDESAIVVLNEIDSSIDTANLHLADISSALSSPLQIDQPVIVAGTKDGSPTGEVFINVNNVKQQILASHNREQLIVYADFGTKNQRVVQIDYSSPTFAGFVAQKLISYTLVSGRYRRDSINWSVI
jgi:hypothetical protein